MALTALQEIPAQNKATEKWSVRRLFPLKAMVAAIGKVFVTPFDFLLALLVVALVVVELFGDSSWKLYLFSALVLGADVYERHASRTTVSEVKKDTSHEN